MRTDFKMNTALSMSLLSTFVLQASGASFQIPLKRLSSPLDGLNAAQQMAALEAMTARAHAKYHHPRSSGGHSRRQATSGSVPLANFESDSLYAAVITVGTPPLSFTVSLDTGSSDLLILSTPCVSGCLPDTPLYNPKASSTYVTKGTPFSIVYAIGGATGIAVNDTVSLGGFTIPGQGFASIDNSTTVATAGGNNGLLGFGWAGISNAGAIPFVQKLWADGKLSEPLFAFAFARSTSPQDSTVLTPGGILSIGSTNISLYTGAIKYIPSASRDYWLIPMEDITVGGVSLNITTSQANIDTGTSLIGMPIAAVRKIYAQIPGSASTGSGGMWTYPCSASVNISFTFGGIAYPMQASDFNTGSAGNGLCAGAIFSMAPDANGAENWLIGDAWLKNVYSVFRFSPSAIGFAPLAAQSVLRTGGVPSGNATVLGGASMTGSPVIATSSVSTVVISTAMGVVPSTSPSKAATSAGMSLVGGGKILGMVLAGLVAVSL